MNNQAVCGNRVAIVVAGIVFLTIFVTNIVLLSYYWPKPDDKDNHAISPGTIRSTTKLSVMGPYILVVMIGIICTSLYVIFYKRCDATAAILVLLLPVLGCVASALQWPSYSLNPLAFGFQVAQEQRFS